MHSKTVGIWRHHRQSVRWIADPGITSFAPRRNLRRPCIQRATVTVGQDLINLPGDPISA